MAVELFANNAQTTLAALVTAGATSLTVASSALFPAASTAGGQFRVLIDTELFLVTNVTGATWTVTPGAEGSTQAGHASGAPVTAVLTAGALNNPTEQVNVVAASGAALPFPDVTVATYNRVTLTAPVVTATFPLNAAGKSFTAELTQDTPLATPATSAFATATTGGTLAAATYFYRVSALNAAGQETLASAETSQVTTGTTSTVTVNWATVASATGYKVYGRTTGAELLLATVGLVLAFTDTGAVAPAGALPGSNTTGANRTMVFPASVKWPGDIAPVLSTAAGKTDLLSWVGNGTSWLGSVAGQNYSAAASALVFAAGTHYLNLDGTATSHVTSPSNASLTAQTNFSIDARMRMANWASGGFVFAKWGANTCYAFYTDTAGKLNIATMSQNGGVFTTLTSSVATGFGANTDNCIRTSVTLHTGSAGIAGCSFWTSSDGVTLTQLGTSIVGVANGTPILSNAQPLSIGADGSNTNTMVGRIYGTRYFASNITNTTPAPTTAVDFSNSTAGAATVTGSGGEVWTVSGPGASII